VESRQHFAQCRVASRAVFVAAVGTIYSPPLEETDEEWRRKEEEGEKEEVLRLRPAARLESCLVKKSKYLSPTRT